jgi:hypothetical protein
MSDATTHRDALELAHHHAHSAWLRLTPVEWATADRGYHGFMADKTIAHYRANPDTLMDLIRECGGPVESIIDVGAYFWAHLMCPDEADKHPDAMALAERWVEGT